MNDPTHLEPTSVWLVGDDLNALELAGRCLQSEAWQVRILGPSSALHELERGARPLVACVEISARNAPILDRISHFRQASPGLRCVLIEGDAELGFARPNAGALEVVSKPVQRSRLVGAVSRAAELSRLDYRVAQLERELQGQDETVTESGVVCVRPEETLNLRELERETITRAIRRADGCMSRAAKLLGIGRATIYRKLASYDSDPRDELNGSRPSPSSRRPDELRYASELS